MAIHPDLKSLILESLPEYLHVAEYCVKFRKDSAWGREQAGGCLGYPAAVMLFSIVDTIGSFYRGRTDLSIAISGKSVHIRGDGFQHFFVLNSEFYGQNLDKPTIVRLYGDFRSLLVHNASLAPSSFLVNDPTVSTAFPVVGAKYLVNVPAFLDISREAVRLFLSRVDEVILRSEQAANIARRK